MIFFPLTSWNVFESQRSSVSPCWTRTSCWVRGMTIWPRRSRSWRRSWRAWWKKTLRWSAQSISSLILYIRTLTYTWIVWSQWTLLCVFCGSAEGEDKLSSSTEEAKVSQWPGPSPWWPGNSLSQASSLGAAKHDWWTDKSMFLIVFQ